MSTAETIVVVAFVVAILLVLGYAVLLPLLRRPRLPDDPETITLTPHLALGQGEQYTAETPAGPAVVTRVWSDEHGGDRYELETYFHRRPGDGDTLRLVYVAPHLPVAKRRLQALAEAHLRGEAMIGERPES